MKNSDFDDPYIDPYGEEEEGDYEDYDEAVRADIGEDIRDILTWKEERDALAERIRPVDVEDLPPVGETPANGFPGYGNGHFAEGYAGNLNDAGEGYGPELQPAAEGYIPVESYAKPGEDFGGADPFPDDRSVDLPPDNGIYGRSEAQKPRKKHRKTSRPYLFVVYAFVLIFFLLIGRLVYFNIIERDAILASPYNRRQDDLAANVRRGSIFASDGSDLAVTQTDELGNETRVYPYGSMFAHVVGYSTNGRSGLEASENVNLLSTHMDLLERAERELKGKKALGDNVLTTLVPKLQQTAWQALGDRRGAVVMLSPKTGAVLAMVSKPDFDPNTIGESWNVIVNDPNNSCLLNRSTQGLYVPGSTYKILTALAYLRKHGTFDGYHYICTGEITEGESVIHCAGGSVHGDLDFAEPLPKAATARFRIWDGSSA
ncbi:MAG: penicillin-binding transpeptidase domain-containing protein [Lachnospiraceae bacterium]